MNSNLVLSYVEDHVLFLSHNSVKLCLVALPALGTDLDLTVALKLALNKL